MITFNKEDLVHGLSDSDSPMVKPGRPLWAEFVVLQDSTAYNVILGRKTINDFSTVVLTKFLMKYEAHSRETGTLFGDREAAQKCSNNNLALWKRSRDATKIFLADLDARVKEQSRPKPDKD
ncbi:hypothetical protein PIB30_066749 [Stylosanthes scabra]|uniref:Uncharacterized protein n=1 Tax=Stylosanthes scabra TaxID=79078 RepID=A0ABU6WM08_9FABA|nr:hypothetical protein [Stylosanthes scabra]